MEIMKLPFEHEIFAVKDYHLVVHQTARDSLAAFLLVWVSSRASRAILEAGGDEELQVKRLKLMAAGIRSFLNLCKTYQTEERDRNATLESTMSQILATIDIRRREYGIQSVDPVALCKLKGTQLILYQRKIVPTARATVEKGRFLTMDEYRQVIDPDTTQAHMQRRRK